MTDLEAQALATLEATTRALMEASKPLRLQIALGRGRLYTGSSTEVLAAMDGLEPVERALVKLDEARASTPEGEPVHG